jgi:polyhydroxybutyrate depolymerase
MNSRGRVVSAEESAAYFVRLDGLREAPREDVWPIRVEDGTRIQLRDWAAPGKPPVELMTVVGGGHVVPQTEFRFPAILGKQSANLDAPPAIWDFFERALAAR